MTRHATIEAVHARYRLSLKQTLDYETLRGLSDAFEEGLFELQVANDD